MMNNAENNIAWLVEYASDETNWVNLENSSYPIYIKNQYSDLREFAKRGNLYGLMLQIKDMFETLIKIPCVLALSVIMQDDSDEQIKKYAKVYSKFLDMPMAMGSWNELAIALVGKKSNIELDESLTYILKETRSLFKSNNKIDVINWRNETIGHGMIRKGDDDNVQNECVELVTILTEFLRNDELDKAYKSIRISAIDNVETDDEIYAADIEIDENQYSEIKCIYKQRAQHYFFDSFMSRKGRANFLSYDTGHNLRNDYEQQKYFRKLYDRYRECGVNLDENLMNEIQMKSRDKFMRFLADDEEYVKPDYAIEELKKAFEAMESGIIFFQMERGMGKTAFTLHLDSELSKKSLIENAMVRTYNLSDANYRGVSDFVVRTNDMLKSTPSNIGDYYINNECGISSESQTKATDMVTLLNAYSSFLERPEIEEDYDYAVYILDGIDELSGDNSKILDFIPFGQKLERGTFIILTSRCEEEAGLSKIQLDNIKTCKEKSDRAISIKRDNEKYLVSLRKFAKKIVPGISDEQCENLIKKGDYRFLNCKLFRNIDEKDISGDESLEAIFNLFLDRIINNRNLYSRKQLLQFLSAITVLGSVTIEEFTELLGCGQLSFGLIGIINDIIPILTVVRTKVGNRYRWSNEAFRELFIKYNNAIAEKYSDNNLRNFINDSQSLYVNWFRNQQETEGRHFENLFSNPEIYKFYISMITGIYKALDELDLLCDFYEHEFYSAFVDSEYIPDLLRLRMDSTNVNRMAAEYVENVYNSVNKVFENDEYKSLFLESITCLKYVQTNIGSELKKFMISCMQEYAKSKDERWLEIAANFDGRPLDNEIVDAVTDCACELDVAEKVVDNMWKRFFKMVKNNYFDRDYITGAETPLSYCISISKHDINRALRDKIDSMYIYINLFLGQYLNLQTNGVSVFTDARNKYVELIGRRGTFITFDDFEECFSFEDDLVNMLAEDYFENREKIREKKQFEESLELIKNVSEEDVAKYSDDVKRVIDFYKENKDSNILDILRDYYYKAEKNIKSFDVNNYAFEENELIFILAELFNKTYEDGRIDRAETIEKEIYWLNNLINLPEWSYEYAEDYQVINVIKRLYAELIWDTDVDVQYRKNLLKKYIYNVNPYIFVTDTLGMHETKEEGPFGEENKMICSPDTLWFLSRFKYMYSEDADSINDLFDLCIANSYELYNRDVPMGIFYFDRFCTCFVKLYLLNQKITGRIVHISEIDFMMEEGDKIIQTIGTFDDDVPLNGFTDYMDMYAVWLLMLGEYEYAKEYYLNLKKILNDNSFIDDDNSAKNQFLLFIDYILNCIGCMLHEEEYFGDYDDYDLRSMSKLHSFMNMLKKGNQQYIDIMKCERTLSTERSILEFRYF